MSGLINPFVRPRCAKCWRGIRSIGQFCVILDRERTRSDRNEHEFSLAVFDIGNWGAGSTEVLYLADALAGRIRSTDEAGWLDDQRIAVFLPDTSADGAWKLANDICQAMETKASAPACEVYTYPSSWFSHNDGDPGQLHFHDISPEWELTKSHGFSASARHIGAERIDSLRQPLVSNGSPRGAALAQRPRPFLLCGLPAWKRAMDIVGTLLALILFFPLLLLITIIIKTISPGPILFKQQRVGHMGNIFTMWKFRTMKVDAGIWAHRQHLAKLINGAACNGDGSETPMTKLDDELQVIPFGRILRETCLDELPQLINVLRGDMSLVGPRPPIPYEVEEYLQWHKARLDAVPGMTGLWQVSGKNRLSFNEMVRLDIQYSRETSLWLDMKILLMTPLAIVSQINDYLQSALLGGTGAIRNA